jgi:hypothetical protein
MWANNRRDCCARVSDMIETIDRAARLRADACVLHVALAAVVAQSAALCQQWSPARRCRPISGGADDAEFVTTALIAGPAMCADCIAQRTGIPRAEIASVIERVRESFRVHMPHVRCMVCRKKRKLYRIREADASDLRLIMVALWDERLCMKCLAGRTGVRPPRAE